MTGLRGALYWLVVWTGLAGALRADDNWPQFRGTTAGVAEGTALPDSWSTTQNVTWKTPIAGAGWSSPIVWGERVYLTSVINEGKSETPKKGLYFGGERNTPSKAVHRWMVYCLESKSGRILWEKIAHKGLPPTPVHIKNTYASETPVTDGERVYAYFGNVGVYCFDRDGNEVWSQKQPSYKTRFGWGSAASPVLYQDRLIIVNDNEEKSFLVALNKYTGKELWRVPRKEKSNWSTPFVWENGERAEIITAGSSRVRANDLDGKPLWELKGMSNIAIPTPFARHGLLYISSGYVLDKMRPVYAIKPGATGNISLKEGETTNDYIAWSNATAGPYNPTPIVYGNYMYILYDRGFLGCFDARTGKVMYDKERIHPGATAFTASPWAYNGKVFCLSEDGDAYVIPAGPTFKVERTNALDEMCMATPALAADGLYIRTQTKLYKLAVR